MRLKSLPALGIALGALAACMDTAVDPTQSPPTAAELEMATFAQAAAEDEATTSSTNAGRWLQRVIFRLRQSDDPEAQQCLAEAEALRLEARALAEAGDLAGARELRHQAMDKILCAIIEVFPEAHLRTGEAVDRIVARIEARATERFGDAYPPRLTRVLEHVESLRAVAIAADDPIDALRANLRAMHVLRRFLHHIRNQHHDQDTQDADDNMNAETS